MTPVEHDPERDPVVMAIEDLNTDEERLALELSAIEDTAKPLDPLEEGLAR